MRLEEVTSFHFPAHDISPAADLLSEGSSLQELPKGEFVMSVVLVPLASGCEELEAVTVIDLLRRAGFEVIVAGLNGLEIRASRNVVLKADQLLDEAIGNEAISLVVLPGGMGGTEALAQASFFTRWLKDYAASGKYLAAICAAPLILDQEGLLENKGFTAYPGVLDHPESDGARYTGAAVEVDGSIITSRGPGTALDFALTLIEVLKDKALRDQVESDLVR